MATKEELQKILDGILPQLNKFGRAKKANGLLSDVERDELYDVVASYKIEDKGWYLNSISKVVSIIKKHPEFAYYDKGYNEDGTPLVSVEMPFLIKQVLFYIYCETKSNNEDLRLNDFLGDLQSGGLYKTKKLLNVGGMTPDGYLDMVRYNQPKNPCLYKGQKKEELAYAIKNLAYQAGSYSYYVDVFGGSGAATTALYPQDRVKQVYNEINPAVYNLFYVLASDGYTQVISTIEALQNSLVRTDFNFDNIFSKLRKILAGWKMNSICPFRDTTSEEKKILDKYSTGYRFDFYSSEKVKGLSMFHKMLDILGDIDNEIQDFGFTKQDIYSWKTDADFDKHWEDIEKIQRALGNAKNNFYRVSQLCGDIIDKDGKVVKSNVRYCDYKVEVTQIKALIFYFYFNKIREEQNGDKVIHTVAEVYLRNLATHGNIISSSIVAYNRGEHEDYKKRTELDNFIHNNYSKTISDFHNRIKRCYGQNLIYRQDFRRIIKGYGNKSGNILFYCDSPYISTSDYDDEKLKVAPFKPKDMEELIEALAVSKKKFIFSMRAVGTTGNSKKRKENTDNIIKYVYEKFSAYKIKNLYVLCVLTINSNKDANKSDLELLIENYKNGVSDCEIMITNYEIVELSEWKKSENADNTYKFKVYKYADFMGIIEKCR